jgi:hypothetical protein
MGVGEGHVIMNSLRWPLEKPNKTLIGVEHIEETVCSCQDGVSEGSHGDGIC